MLGKSGVLAKEKGPALARWTLLEMAEALTTRRNLILYT
jgi:hypothetical protein